MLEYKKDTWKAVVSLAPTLILMAVFTFWPIINALRMSFMNGYNLAGSANHTFQFGVENYVQVLQDPLFFRSLKNTALMVLISVPLTIVVGLLIAVALNSIKKLQSFFQTIFFLPYVTNTIALGLVFSTLFNKEYGLVNQILGESIHWVNGADGPHWGRAMFVLTLYTLWDGLAFKIIVFLSGLQSIDKQYYQAAQIDAASKWTTFRRITVPLLSPMILYITITSFIGAFKAYSSVIAIFNNNGNMGPGTDTTLLMTVVGYIYKKLNGSSTLQLAGVASAASIILFAIIMLITLVQMQVSKKRVHY